MKKLLLLLLFLPLTAYGQTAVGNITILGASCAVTNACVIDTLAASASSASIALTGTWTATVQFEASPDGGTTYVAINGTPPNSTTAVTSATANGVWTFNVGSMTHLRARASALASGTVGVNINASAAPILVSGGGGAPTGAAGGSLAGTYPNPTLSNPVSIPGATSGNVTLTAPAIAGTSTNPLVSSNVFQLPVGTTASPGVQFTGSTNSGLMHGGFGTYVVDGGGVICRFALGTGVVCASNASVGFSAGTDPTGSSLDTAISRDAAGVVDVGTGAVGSKAGSLNLTNLTATGQVLAGNGTTGAPGYGFGDANLGLVDSGANLLLVAPSAKVIDTVISGSIKTTFFANGDWGFSGGKGQHIETQAANNDLAGTCTAAAATTCVVTFTTAYTAVPSCVATDQTNIIALKVTPATGTLTITTTGASSDVFAYHCISNPN